MSNPYGYGAFPDEGFGDFDKAANAFKRVYHAELATGASIGMPEMARTANAVAAALRAPEAAAFAPWLEEKVQAAQKAEPERHPLAVAIDVIRVFV